MDAGKRVLAMEKGVIIPVKGWGRSQVVDDEPGMCSWSVRDMHR
jgi:hypothetical protein